MGSAKVDAEAEVFCRLNSFEKLNCLGSNLAALANVFETRIAVADVEEFFGGTVSANAILADEASFKARLTEQRRIAELHKLCR
jgi:hypothetical protein